MSLRFYAVLFLIFAVLGLFLEWGYGTLWSAVGICPWIYPDSPLLYSSLEGMPLWGFGGVFGISLYRALAKKRARELLGALISAALTVLWILFCALVLS